MSWRRWPWIEEGVLPLLISTMRLCWIWPWLLMLSRWLLPAALQPVLPLWNVALLLIGGAATTHALPVDRQRPRRARLLAAAIGLAAVALTLWLRLASDAYALWDLRWLAAQGVLLTHWGGEFSPSFLVLILAASLWLRGMLDNPAPTHDDVWRAFIRGFVALTLLLIAGRIDPAGPPASTARWLVLFFAAGMAALALAGLRLARNTRQKDAPLLVNRYWLSTILTVTLILLGVGLLLGLLITPGAVAWLFGWTRVVASWIGSIIGYVFYGIAYVLFLFLTPLIAWVQARMGVPEPMELSGGLQQQLEDTLQRRTPVALPPALDESLRWLGLAGALAVVALAFALALYALRRRKEEEIDETREIILTADLLRDQAAELWRRWRDRLRRSAAPDDPFLSLAGEEPLRRAVRAVYQEFLAAMMRLGAPRFPRQTPAAYAHEAASTLPGAASALERLTAAYVAARYDPRPPAAEDALAAQAAWAEIQAQLAAQATSPNGGGEPARE